MALGNGLLVFLIAGIALGALCAALALPLLVQGAFGFLRQAQVRVRLTEQGHRTLRAALVEDLCRNGIPLVRPLASLLLRLRSMQGTCSRIATALSFHSEALRPQSVCELGIASSVLAALVLLALTTQVPMALLGVLAPWWLAGTKADKHMRRRAEMLREQLPDALNAIGMCFSAGYTLQQALAQTAEETPEPLGGHLRRTAHDISVGVGVSEALALLEARTACADLCFVAVALDIQHATGGSLKEILEGASASITESFDMARSLEVQTAQARLSARIVTVMPLVLLAVLSLAMEGYLATFFSSPAGFALLACAMGMELLGIMLIRRILGVDIG
ncbi:MAG: type II secretion system F family protein [Coriobacteriales bacterium]|jgi:tight adherence protein B|nr:type II secretion system F family protein [Coriobacteriales bacterium]